MFSASDRLRNPQQLLPHIRHADFTAFAAFGATYTTLGDGVARASCNTGTNMVDDSMVNSVP
jgi:hypothetical protein